MYIGTTGGLTLLLLMQTNILEADNKPWIYVGLCDFFTLCLMGFLQENVDGQGEWGVNLQ